MAWVFQSDQPLYAQLVEQITLAILSGGYAPGERMLAVRELAAQAGVNPNTVQRAMGELEQLGLIRSQRTSGRFVTEDAAVIQNAKEELAAARLRDFLTAMERLGYDKSNVLQLLQEKEESNGASGM